MHCATEHGLSWMPPKCCPTTAVFPRQPHPTPPDERLLTAELPRRRRLCGAPRHSLAATLGPSLHLWPCVLRGPLRRPRVMLWPRPPRCGPPLVTICFQPSRARCPHLRVHPLRWMRSSTSLQHLANLSKHALRLRWRPETSPPLRASGCVRRRWPSSWRLRKLPPLRPFSRPSHASPLPHRFEPMPQSTGLSLWPPSVSTF
mmetsp:Transcript_93725/g.303491  ORF Transcript_93725/g.303491 Transcript_93725/m.303491 type:complete len:202 (+) Transcript_93725:526-1131(+)